jgi:hypothetical protein
LDALVPDFVQAALFRYVVKFGTCHAILLPRNMTFRLSA